MPHRTLLKRPYTSAAAVLVAMALIAGGLLLARAGRAAVTPSFPGAPALPVMPDTSASAAALGTQPVALQTLDATHFVVVTREPRLVSHNGEEGRYYNMILNVVTYYTVQNGHLIPTEHVHVPQGWRALAVGG
jgi:hypothetical protein